MSGYDGSLAEVQNVFIPYDIGGGLIVDIVIPYDQLGAHLPSLLEAGVVKAVKKGEETADDRILGVIRAPGETPNIGRR